MEEMKKNTGNHVDDNDLPPELDDFTDVIKTIKPNQQNQCSNYIGDYAKTREELEQEMKEKLKIEQQKQQQNQDQVNKQNINEVIQKQAATTSTKDKQQDQQPLFSGLKKGFLTQDSNASKQKKSSAQQQIQNKNEEVVELKGIPKEQQKNKFEIPEVQQSMKLGNYLEQNKQEWLSEDLLKKVGENPKLQKLFSNPELLQAFTMMQKNPKEVIEKYGKNPEFMMILQEFCQLMGGHFQQLSEQQSQVQKPQAQQQQQQQQYVQQTTDPQQQAFEKALQDPQVQEILKDPKVVSLINYIQQNKQIDFHQIVMKDEVLGKKLRVLIDKGIIKLQGF